MRGQMATAALEIRIVERQSRQLGEIWKRKNPIFENDNKKTGDKNGKNGRVVLFLLSGEKACGEVGSRVEVWG